jgi:hypothetical protein
MTKRPISYTSRDFESIKDSLTNYAKRYYPTTFKDFNEASFGALMLDLVSYVGDQLSFYVDYQANESFLDSAIEFRNVTRLANTMGYKTPGAPSASGICSFYIIIPAAATTTGPDFDYIPILKKGTLVGTSNSVMYTLNEDVDFSDPSNSVTVATVNTTSGVPTSFAIKAYGKVISGQQFPTTVTVGDYERFLRIPVGASNVVEVLSVTDSQGNDYLEVEFLTQDYVLKEVPNLDISSRAETPYIMRLYPAPRRYALEFDELGDAFLQFGYGSSENITTDVIADPSDVVLDVTGRNYVTDRSFDPSQLVQSDKFGVVPTETVLNIIYRANDSDHVNSSVGSITTVVNPQFVFPSASKLTSEKQSDVLASLEVVNENPVLGDTEELFADEVKERAYAAFASQNRAVTRSDYLSVCYRMPAKFGKIKRANVVQDRDSLRRNLNLYVLSENTQGNFIVPNSVLKENLRNWILQYKMMNDTIDIFPGRIINYGINFEVIPELDINRYQLLQNCVDELKSKLDIKKDIGEAIYISEIYKFLNDVPGVIDTTSVEVTNKNGGVYSSLFYDIRGNTSDDGRYIIIPNDTVAEILYPDQDITGVIK